MVDHNKELGERLDVGDTLESQHHVDNVHSDIAFTNTHSDIAHSDIAFSNSHTDIAHSDIAFTNSHTDIAHTDIVTKVHSDIPFSNSHTDIAHSDIAFSNSHTDIAHSDIAFTNSHTDIAHSDIAAEDTNRYGVVLVENYHHALNPGGTDPDTPTIMSQEKDAETLQVDWFRIFGELNDQDDQRIVEVGKVIAEDCVLVDGALTQVDWYRDFVETMTATDSLVKEIGKVIAEELSLTDAEVHQVFYNLFLSDVMTPPSEAVIKEFGKYILEWPGPFNPFFVEDPDEPQPGDVPPGIGNLNEQVIKEIGKVTGTSLTLADSVSRAVAWFRKVGDALTAQDAVNWQSRFFLMLGDSWTATDRAVKQIGKKVTSLASMSDAVAKTMGKVVPDALSLDDDRPIFEIGKVISNVLSLNSRAIVSCIHVIELQEILQLVDESRKTIRKVLEDTMAAPDDDSRRRVIKSLGETLTLTESPIIKEIGKFLRETTRIVDALGLVKEVDKVVADSLDLDDEVRRRVDWFRTLTELFTLQDEVRKAFAKFLTEDLTLDGVLEIQWLIQRKLGEALTLADAVTTQVEFNRYLAELAQSSDSVKKTFGKILVETLNLEETFKRRVRFFREMGETFPSPEDTVLKSVGKRAADVVQIADGSLVFGVNKVLGEAASMADLPVTKEFFKQLVETLVANDGLRKEFGKRLEESTTFSEYVEQVVPLIVQLGDQMTISDALTTQRIAFAISFVLVLLDSRVTFETVDREAREQVQLDDQIRTELLDDEFGA